MRLHTILLTSSLVVLTACKSTDEASLGLSMYPGKGQSGFSVKEYFDDCSNAMDLAINSFPEIKCSDLVKPPKYHVRFFRRLISTEGYNGGKCFNPDGAGAAEKCSSSTSADGFGSYLVLNRKQEVVYFSLSCTEDYRQVVAYHPVSGSSCYFHKGKSLREPHYSWDIENLYNPSTKRSCLTCHSPHPFTKTPYVMTLAFESALGRSDFFDRIERENPESFKGLDEDLLSAWAYDGFDWETEFAGRSQIFVQGVPKTVVFDPKSKEWKSMEQTVVSRDKLEDISAPGAWTIKDLNYGDDFLKTCDGACHRLTATHHNARMAAMLYSVCDGQSSAKVCIGFDHKNLRRYTDSVMHELLFGYSVGVDAATRAEIDRFASDCIGRQSIDTKCKKKPRVKLK